MNILFDATLPPRLARALNILLQPTDAAMHTRDVLGNDASDSIVLDYVRQYPDSAMIGIDVDITDNPHRIAALREYGCPVFLLSSAWLELKEWSLVWMLTHRLPSILQAAHTVKGSAIFLVPPAEKGRIRKLG